MPTSPKTQKIVSHFSRVENVEKQRRWKREEIEEAVADSPVNDYNNPPLIRMRNRIEEMKNEEASIERHKEKAEQRSHDYILRAWDVFLGIAIGLIIAGLSNFFFFRLSFVQHEGEEPL